MTEQNTPTKRAADQRAREQRLRALELAVEVVKTNSLRAPGTAALVTAHEFAGFLADGTLPADAQKVIDATEADK